ncbi:MAG: 1,4-beta-D-glucan glucohydrolase [Erythrobacter sp.]|nr:1,4-beta-D-glucan glucohydrolase [Erythrobacter sp.]
MRLRAVAIMGALGLAGCTPVAVGDAVNVTAPPTQGAKQSADLSALLARMSLEHKVAQLIQPDIGSITPADVREYRFGSVLNGGNSGPGGDDLAPAPEWLALADAFWEASTAPLPGGEPAIPALWAADAMHGHSNVIGATLFPHNVALGATRDPDLVRRIGAATALEIEVTGLDWTFAPTIAVARDDRWGRTYESYSEDPHLVAQMGAAMVEGLQGRRGDADYLGAGRVIATGKHFFGDGGTAGGVDQGDVNGNLEALKAIHVVPYPAAIAQGVEGVMASFNSINGLKMHGNGALLTGLLRGELGFDGIVVGDWNGHGQIDGCTNSDCPQALLAGLDIYMVPEDWKALHASLLAQAHNGTIPMARIDEAVMRVLRLKQRAGILGGVKPSARPNAGNWEILGNPAHRAIAREAVAKSLVLLKNDGVLPLKAGASILVAGSAADNIAQQNGGWTLTWQGGGELTNGHFPGATSIWNGLEAAARESDGNATLSVDGSFDQRPDVAVVVFGEKPYAEFVGDRKDLALRDEEGLELLRRLKAQGVPTVAVLLSGRPLWMNRELNAADAFVAAWLPGSEGGGVADVLFGARPAGGRLSFSWPAKCDGGPVNGPEGALFAFGYGREIADRSPMPSLDEACGALEVQLGTHWFEGGRLADGARVFAADAPLPDFRGNANGITARGIDRNAQEDARAVSFQPGATLVIEGPAGRGGLRIAYAVDQRPAGPVTLGAGDASIDLTHAFAVAEGKGWREMVLSAACLPEGSDRLAMTSQGVLRLSIAAIVREDMAEGTGCSF